MERRARYTPVETPDTVRQSLIKKGFAAPDRLISPPALLTFPRNDLQGDFVVPEGIHWVPRPFVNLDHGPPVGWALETPVLQSIKAANGEWENVQVGQTKFFGNAKDVQGADLNILDQIGNPTGRKYTVEQCLHEADQCAALVEHRIMDGVSLEFESEQAHKIGRSYLEKRDALCHTKSLGLGWAHTEKPVNPDARLLVQEKAEKIQKALENPRLTENIQQILRKSLTAMPAYATVKRTIVRGNYEPTDEGEPMAHNRIAGRLAKAIPTDDEEDEFVADPVDNDAVPPTGANTDEPMGDDEPEGEAGPTPAVKELYNLAQTLSDLCGAHDEGMGMSEHVGARKFSKKLCGKMQKLAAEAQSMADKVAQELSGAGMDGTDEDGDDEADEGATDEETPDDEEEFDPVDGEDDNPPDDEEAEGKKKFKALRTDDAGYIVCKAFPQYQPARYKMSDLKPPRMKKAAKEEPADEELVQVSKAEWDAIMKYVDKLD